MTTSPAHAAAREARDTHLIIVHRSGEFQCGCGDPVPEAPGAQSEHVLDAVVAAVLQSVIAGAESLYPLDKSMQDRVKWAVGRAEGTR